jgi:ssDNA-binding Zn-finger/Zn-ribbon topoisomerase 1
MRIHCPHCGHPGRIRTSRTITQITREAYVQCENIRCCHVWKIIISAVTTIVPSIHPNPEVFIRPAKKTAAVGPQLSLLDK